MVRRTTYSRLGVLLPIVVLVALIAVRAAEPAVLVQLRTAVFDQFQQLKPRHQALEKSFVRIVDIDDESLRRIGQWPWPRTTLARLIRQLHRNGAVVVALDMILSEQDRISPRALAKNPAFSSLKEKLLTLPDNDQVLSAAIAAGPVVTAFVLKHERTRPPRIKAGFGWGGYDPGPFIFSFSGALTNFGAIDKGAAGTGAINYIVSRDQIIRRIPLVLRVGETLAPSFAAEILRVASGARGFKIRTTSASGDSSGGARTGITAIQIGRAPVPTDANGRLVLYAAPVNEKRMVPAWAFLTDSPDARALAQTIKNRIVLVGTSAAGLKDLRATPLGRNVPGVEIHAQAIDQILANRHLHRPDYAFGLELSLLAVLGLVLIITLLRVGAIGSTVIFAGFMAGIGAGAWYAFAKHRLLLDPSWTVLSLGTLFLATTVLSYLRAEQQRNRVRSAFSHYLAPAMVNRLAQDPSALRLGGETRDLTVLFSDVRGFTGISERFDAAGLTTLMNRFLTPMTSAILERGGTVDKYMGDAIMAFWNAPLPQEDHPAQACRAALDMMERLQALNATLEIPKKPDEATPPTLEIGIGINSGLCNVGNMGSDQRFDYSALGDEVNLASRLEGLCKQYGVNIIVGEATKAAANADLLFLELDLIQVKGRSKPARIFALVGETQACPESEWRRMVDQQGQFLSDYRNQHWPKALAYCRELMHVSPTGPVLPFNAYYTAMESRIRQFEKEPPPRDWGGVYTATEK